HADPAAASGPGPQQRAVPGGPGPSLGHAAGAPAPPGQLTPAAAGPDRRTTLDALVGDIRTDLGAAHRAREVALPACRTAIRHAGLAIRAVHRGDPAAHDEQVAASEAALRTAQEALADHPMVAHAGFLH